jgi:hypothetical protein
MPDILADGPASVAPSMRTRPGTASSIGTEAVKPVDAFATESAAWALTGHVPRGADAAMHDLAAADDSCAHA